NRAAAARDATARGGNAMASKSGADFAKTGKPGVASAAEHPPCRGVVTFTNAAIGKASHETQTRSPQGGSPMTALNLARAALESYVAGLLLHPPEAWNPAQLRFLESRLEAAAMDLE